MPIKQLCIGIMVLTIVALSNGNGQAQVSPAIGVSPTSLSFTAAQGGTTPVNLPLSISNTGRGTLTWTASDNASWLTLSPASGTGNGTVTATATTGSLTTGTYSGVITLSATGAETATVPVTFYVTTAHGAGPPAPPPIPASANEAWKAACVDKSLNLNGDFQESKSFLGFWEGQWSVGPAVSTQLVKYDMAKKQAGFNTSVGAGVSFRFYRNITIRDAEGAPKDQISISQIKRECRQTSFGSAQKSYLASPMFSITPTLYATKPTNEGDLSVQPALLLGLFEDILNVGVGFNLTGSAAEKGHVFLLMSIGTGFSF